MKLDKPAAVGLARLVEVLRGWNFAGTLAAIEEIEADSATDIIAIVNRCLADPRAETPGAFQWPKYRQDPVRKTESAPAPSDAERATFDRQRLREFREQEARERAQASTSKRIGEIRAAAGWPRGENWESIVGQ